MLARSGGAVGRCVLTVSRNLAAVSSSEAGAQASPSHESIDKMRARLLYQSKKRGILENDILLGDFADANLNKMDKGLLQKYDARPTAKQLRIVFVSVPAGDKAAELARLIVNSHLGACVKVLPPLTSYYIYEGQFNEDAEQVLMIKTSEAALEELEQLVRSNHPYDVPEFLAVPVDYAHAPYAEWVKNSVKPRKN